MVTDKEMKLVAQESDVIPLVSDLYTEARRVALKVDESLDSILEQLGRMDA